MKSFVFLLAAYAVQLSSVVLGMNDHKSSADPGDLVQVDTDGGTIGVLLDEFAFDANLFQRALDYYTNSVDDNFWDNRVYKQTELTNFRMAFRSSFYPGKKQLFLPWFGGQSVRYDAPARLELVDGHHVVMRKYHMRTYLVGSSGSAQVSDPALKHIGGQVNETYVFPIDPQLIVQRTGYACMDEDQFPYNSVDAEAADIYFDDTCTAGPPETPNSTSTCRFDITGCHCTKGADLDCPAQIEASVGRTLISFIYTRILWDETIATKAEALNVHQVNDQASGADLIGSSYMATKREFIIYRYISNTSCEFLEEDDGCTNAPGWRKLLLFDALSVNIGTKKISIGLVPYVDHRQETFDAAKTHNLYYWDKCHDHPHFSHYALYTVGNNTLRKQGFCIQDTHRIVNSRWSPLHADYDSCQYQGVTNGKFVSE
jgi:hypothetical protein